MIGIYGGTFNPIHYGHLRTALEVKEKFSLTEIRLLPCSQPAHKTSTNTTAEQRLKMLMLATENQSDLMIDLRELNRPGVSYMIDSLKSIRNEIDNTPLLLFIGTDSFQNITSWRQWQSLFDYAHIVVITRPQYNKQQALSSFLQSKRCKTEYELNNKSAGYLFFQAVTQLDISATTIRNLIANNMNPGYLLPDKVINYIKQNKLYIAS